LGACRQRGREDRSVEDEDVPSKLRLFVGGCVRRAPLAISHVRADPPALHPLTQTLCK